MNEGAMLLQIRPETIRRTASQRMAGLNLAEILIHQAWTESRLFLHRHVNFRKNRNAEAVEAYCAMNISEFEGINARQRWANWRTIPKNLAHRLVNRPVMAIDLCCGVGHSTEVLACYLPEGSRILGLEYNPDFVKTAGSRKYFTMNGSPCDVSFSAQSVLEEFRDSESRRVESESVDLVNCCGAVGVHFDADATARLSVEVARVLKRGGLAMIDSGAPGTQKKELVKIFEGHGFEVLHLAKSCIFDRYTQVCFRKL